MDANGLQFQMLSAQKQWNLRSNVQYDGERRSLRLASQRLLDPPGDSGVATDRTPAQNRLLRVPQTRDSYGNRAFWNSTEQAVMATGALPGSVAIYRPSLGNVPTDLAMGYDGILYVAIDGNIVMLDRRGRWPSTTLGITGFRAWRLAADPRGGVWALDRGDSGLGRGKRLARLRGEPLRQRPFGLPASPDFEPDEENPDPPVMTIMAEAQWEDNETPVAIATSPGGRLAVLNWVVGGIANLRCLDRYNRWSPPIQLQGAISPYSLAWVSEDEVAVLLTTVETEALVYPVGEDAEDPKPSSAGPLGNLYPLKEQYDGGPFLRGVSLPPNYPTDTGSEPLYHLSLPSYALEGAAASKSPLDSGSTQTVWHRLYLEASIPPNCGIKVFLAATNTPEDTVPDNDWHEHQFGKGFADRGAPGIPVGAWVPSPSEIPLHPGLGLCPMEKDHAGLFTVLVQRSHRPVRTLQGQYLHVRVEFYGDKLSSPELWALRAYASRFSYLNNYLPELYRETRFGPDADHYQVNVQSTPADFLERFLDNFEGILTPLEDLISSSYLLTDPRSTREDALEWLASWIGLSIDSAYPVHRRRRLLLEAPRMYKYRGTLCGLERALDVATDDGVRQGRVLVLENFRLRRAFATILGADLADEDDPLLAGLAVSGNSYVGDTLFLGDEEKKEFLALFNTDLPKDFSEQTAIAELYDRLAYRVTVLVHEEVVPEELGLIRRVVDLETPAHVLARVITATYPLMVGIASLVGIDTYLREGPVPLPVRVEESRIGLRDFIQRPPSLDPRLEGGREWLSATQRPVADPRADSPVEIGESITLDGSRSRSPEGLSIIEYLWRILG